MIERFRCPGVLEIQHVPTLATDFVSLAPITTHSRIHRTAQHEPLQINLLMCSFQGIDCACNRGCDNFVRIRGHRSNGSEMDDSSAAPDRDVESPLLRHVLDDGGGVAADAVFVFEVLAGPDGLFGVADGAADAVAVVQELVDDVHA